MGRNSSAPDASDPRPPPPLGGVVGLTESLVLLTEYMLLSSLAATCVRASGVGPGPDAIVASVLGSGAVLAWILYRHWSSYRIPIKVYLQLLGLLPVRLSPWTVSFAAFQLGSHAALYWIHDYYGSAAVSWRNLLDADGRCDWTRLADLALVAPVREELVFRGVLLLVLHRRLSSDKLSVVLGASTAFSLTHLVNFASTIYSFQYVSVQLFLSLLIAMFYTMRVISSGSLWDSILLHCVNNLLACFVRLGPELNLIGKPLLLLPLLQTFVIFFVVISSAWKTFDVVFHRYTLSRFRLVPSHDLYQLQDLAAAS